MKPIPVPSPASIAPTQLGNGGMSSIGTPAGIKASIEMVNYNSIGSIKTAEPIEAMDPPKQESSHLPSIPEKHNLGLIPQYTMSNEDWKSYKL